MPPLPSDLRNKLERAIIDARDIAAAGAQAALETMAVHHYDPYPNQTPEQRKLRNHLRAHARQLGDQQDSKGKLHITHLIHECAYEHWHRMLFARFLAENDLLIEPSSGMAISLQECEELAKKAETDLWAFASRCAQQMLPQIFRPDDPLLQVTLAREHRGKLEALLSGLPQAVFKADDALGWVYQFWQSKKKDEVNASGQKINGDALPAVTQLFTEHYMVLFLLHNTIGAWHAGKVLAENSKLAELAETEEDIRRAVALKAAGGYSFDYLRFVRGEDGPWKPAAGTFEGWPKHAAELKILDPSCGSGHFLVAVFALLVRLRMEEESIPVTKAADAVLRDNIFGLELDSRCTQIAAFNLALAAWRRGSYRPLPSIKIACSGLAPNTTEQTWVALAGKNPRLRAGMEALYQLFKKAPDLGSLINPEAIGEELLAADFHELQPLLEKALSNEVHDEFTHELAVTASGIAKAAEILASQFTLVVTNVPYIGQKKQDSILKQYCAQHHPLAKADLATCFVERCLTFCKPKGSIALVTPQNWLFLGAYRELRSNLLKTVRWEAVARLGPRAFETISGEIVNVSLIFQTKQTPPASHKFLAFDVAMEETPKTKAVSLSKTRVNLLSQEHQLLNPDHRLRLEPQNSLPLLGSYAISMRGIVSGDGDYWYRQFWEFPTLDSSWRPLQSTVRETLSFGGREQVINWSTGGDGMLRPGTENRAYGHSGVALGQIGTLPATLYTGELYDNNTGVIVPIDPRVLPAIWAYCSSPEFAIEVRKLDQALKVTNATFTKVPFDLAHWERVALAQYPRGLPTPHSDDPTQWIFAGHPNQAKDPLQIALARMLGYRWPRQTGSAFPDCPATHPDGLEQFTATGGIVCIPSIRGDDPAADKLGKLLEASGIKPDRNLDDWLRNIFFEEHCKLFQHRPFIWHIWDGRKQDGFHALVNYHRLVEGNGKGRKLLESLTYSYLGDWISRQQDGVKRGVDGAEDRLAAATALQKGLESILGGEPPFDIFVRWKPLEQQPIGWEPDINDGVRMNIRPFLTGALPGGRDGTGVLRWKPNIKWQKDRGTEPHRPKREYPWFWGWDENREDFVGGKDFTGDRFNACHYSTTIKRAALESVKLHGSKR